MGRVILFSFDSPALNHCGSLPSLKLLNNYAAENLTELKKQVI